MSPILKTSPRGTKNYHSNLFNNQIINNANKNSRYENNYFQKKHVTFEENEINEKYKSTYEKTLK